MSEELKIIYALVLGVMIGTLLTWCYIAWKNYWNHK